MRAVAVALPLTLFALAPAAAQDDEDRPLWEPPPTAAFAEVDFEALVDDRRDRWTIRDIRQQWSDGIRHGDALAIRDAEDRLMRWLEEEVREDRADVATEEHELAVAREVGSPARAAIARMELMRARADLAQTERALQQYQGLQLAFAEGRATGDHYVATADLMERITQMADVEMDVTREENRMEREAYLETVRTRGTYDDAFDGV